MPDDDEVDVNDMNENEGEEGEGQGEGNEGSNEGSNELATLQARLDIAEERNKELEAKVEEQGTMIAAVREDKGEDEGKFSKLPSPETLEEMSNTELAKTILDQVTSSDLETRIAAVEGSISKRRTDELSAKAEALAKEFPDFLEHKKAIVALAANGLGMREAYMIARLRSGKGLPEARKKATASERPTSVVLRKAKDEKPAKIGPRGFSEDLKEVLDRMDFTVPQG